MVEFNENELNNLFAKAKNEPVHTSFADTEKKFTSMVNSVESTKKKSLFTLKNGIMITLISTIVVATMLTTSQTEGTDDNSNKMIVQREVSEQTTVQDEILNKERTLKVEKRHSLEKKNDQVISIVKKSKNESYSFENGEKKIVKKEKTTQFETVFKFPVLTEKEKIENQKRKRKMLKYLVKFSKKEYVFVPSGNLVLENQKKSIQSFYIQAREVTNMQYRTFLMDLVEKGEKEKFKLASPQLDVWPSLMDSIGENPLNKVYFSHPAYDEYPVVGISQKGAELYTEWLTEEVIVYNPSRKLENTWIKVRIPTDVEWMYCANEGSGEIKHQWSSEGLQNEAGCYLANFEQEKSEDGAMYTAKTKTST